jgi:sulfur-oxidizing protein SoxA
MREGELLNRMSISLAAAVAVALAAPALAQTAPPKRTAEGIAKYRKLLEDGNPAELFEAKGEDLWARKRGRKNA